jgi:hypothetical protein
MPTTIRTELAKRIEFARQRTLNETERLFRRNQEIDCVCCRQICRVILIARYGSPRRVGLGRQAIQIACDFEIAQTSQSRKLGVRALTAQIKSSR